MFLHVIDCIMAYLDCYSFSADKFLNQMAKIVEYFYDWNFNL